MRRALSLVVLATVVILAGCGGSSSNQLSNQEYASKLKQYLTPLSQQFFKLQAEAPSATTTQQLSSELAATDSSLQKASQQMAALDPPSAAASSNADLVSAIDTIEKSVAQTEQAVRSGTAGQMKAQVAALKSANKQFVSRVNQIRGQLASEGVVKVGTTG